MENYYLGYGKRVIGFCLFVCLAQGAQAEETQPSKTEKINLNNAKTIEAPPVVLSKIVGVAGDQIVTSREVQIVNLLEKALGEDKELKLIPIDDAKFFSEITQVLLEIVVWNESLVFEMTQISEDEFKEVSERIAKKTINNSDWKRLQVSQMEFEKFLKRKIIAKKFIKIKSDSMKGFISDQEAKEYFEKNRLKFGQIAFSQFKENIKTFLTQQQLEERLTVWFEVIKKKYKVKNYSH